MMSSAAPFWNQLRTRQKAVGSPFEPLHFVIVVAAAAAGREGRNFQFGSRFRRPLRLHPCGEEEATNVLWKSERAVRRREGKGV